MRRKNKYEQKDRIKEKDVNMSICDQEVEDQLLVGTRRPASYHAQQKRTCNLQTAVHLRNMALEMTS
jgi:hypothetical protein